jgi:hypothetical protein
VYLDYNPGCRDQSEIRHIVETVGTYSITSPKWFWNVEPLGPGILFKGSYSGKTINMFKSQTIPLASKSRRDTAATLAAMMPTLRMVFHTIMVLDREMLVSTGQAKGRLGAGNGGAPHFWVEI